MPAAIERPAESSLLLWKGYGALSLTPQNAILPEDTVLPENESKDISIKAGDTLISAESIVHILGYDLDADAFLCDIFNLDGKLIGNEMPIRATIIETCFRKKG